jgi:hypothetical protein
MFAQYRAEGGQSRGLLNASAGHGGFHVSMHRAGLGRVGHRCQSSADVIDESLIRAGHEDEGTVAAAQALVRS